MFTEGNEENEAQLLRIDLRSLRCLLRKQIGSAMWFSDGADFSTTDKAGRTQIRNSAQHPGPRLHFPFHFLLSAFDSGSRGEKLSLLVRVSRKVQLLPFVMKLCLLLVSLSIACSRAFAADAAAAAAPQKATDPSAPAVLPAPTAELKALVDRIQAKLGAGKNTAADLADELAAFDKLFAKYRAQKTDEVAQILYMQATLYTEVLQDNDKALQLLQVLKKDFAATELGASADKAIDGIEATAKAAKIQAELIGRPAPELHFKWSSRDGLKTLSELKGKVVVLDFWATWCGPCVASFPNVRELVAHYKDRDVVVLGVTSLQGAIVGLEKEPINTRNDPTKEYALMKDYIKAKEITWSIAFSNEEVFNPDYGIRGIPYMAIIAPDGTVRHAGLHPGIPAEEKYAKIDAILKEFGKKLPFVSEPNK
jgi:thiol-disulfide isomerase/thioredoxin